MILIPEKHLNRITGSKVTANLLNGWILPIGGASVANALRLQPAQQACFLRSGHTMGTEWILDYTLFEMEYVSKLH